MTQVERLAQALLQRGWMLATAESCTGGMGAVSEAAVRAMALGALRHSKAQVSVAVSGVAGPGGGSRSRPVGTVWMAWCVPGDSGPTLGAETAFIKTECVRFDGDRAAVREATVEHVLETLLGLLGASDTPAPVR